MVALSAAGGWRGTTAKALGRAVATDTERTTRRAFCGTARVVCRYSVFAVMVVLSLVGIESAVHPAAQLPTHGDAAGRGHGAMNPHAKAMCVVGVFL